MLAVAGLACAAQAQISGDVIKIGLITDMSGVYSDIDGQGGAEARQDGDRRRGGVVARQAVEFVSADHQNKADVAASKAREWFDQQGVDMLIGGTNSGTSLAMAKVAADKKRVFVAIGAGTSGLTNEECTPYTVHYAYDTVALARGTGSAIVKRGGKNWYFLTADYAFGQSLEKDTTDVIKANGGKVLGSVKHPLGAARFFVLPVAGAGSNAQILGLANAGGDTINSHQGRQRVRPHQEDEAGRLADVYQRHPFAGFEHDAGHVPDRRLVLGHERRHARLVQALFRKDQGSRRCCRRPTIPPR